MDRPFIHINAAITVAGSMRCPSGRSISCPEDWQRVHLLREKSDGVAVGRITWEQDCPRLDCRRDRLGRLPRRQPARVIFWGSRPNCLVSASSSQTVPTYVVGNPDMIAHGTTLVRAADRKLPDPLQALHGLGLGSILVEGGPTLLSSFIKQGCADRVTLYVATRLAAVAREAAHRALPDLPTSAAVRATPFGEGTLLTYEFLSSLGPAEFVKSSCSLPTERGTFRLWAYRFPGDDGEHVALVHGRLLGAQPPLVRLHSQCLTGDVLGSCRCDCGRQLGQALDRIVQEGRGALVYLRQEGRGIGLHAKVAAYALQDHGLDTLEANLLLGYAGDARSYEVAAAILRDLGVSSLRLLTNTPAKMLALRQAGLQVTERVPLVTPGCIENASYLATKVLRMGHDPALLAGLTGSDERQ